MHFIIDRTEKITSGKILNRTMPHVTAKKPFFHAGIIPFSRVTHDHVPEKGRVVVVYSRIHHQRMQFRPVSGAGVIGAMARTAMEAMGIIVESVWAICLNRKACSFSKKKRNKFPLTTLKLGAAIQREMSNVVF